MKRYYCTLILILPVLLVAGAIEQDVSFPLNALTFDRLEGFDIVRLKGCIPTTIVGEPELAMKSLVMVIPPHAQIEDVEIVSAEKILVQGTYHILPAQHPQPFSLDEPLPFVEPKADVYAYTTAYPGVLAEIIHSGTKGGYQLVTVVVYPLQYMPKQRELVLYTDITLRVTYSDGQKIPETVWREEHELHKEAVRQLITNPEQLEQCRPLIKECDRSVRGSVPNASFDNPEYVIMVADGFESFFEPLREWKIQKGVPTEIFTRDWILSMYSGADVQEQIRNFIIDYHQNHGTFYFLCVGDWDDFPMKGMITSSVPGELVPSDFYYQDYDDDLYSDVFVGRASVSNETEVQTFVNKVLLYEKEPPEPGTGFYDKIFMPAYVLWSDYGCPVNDTIAMYDPESWLDAKRYDWESPLTTQEISDSMNVGFACTNISAHGGWYLWGGTYYHTNSDAAALTNAPPRTGVMTAICCNIGMLDYASDDCYVEYMMNNPHGGATAFWGNSRYGYGRIVNTGRSEWLCMWFYDELTNNHVYNIGRTCALAKDRSAPYAADGIVVHCMKTLNLFGDPEMPIWAATPDYLTVNHIPEVQVGVRTVYFEVTAGDEFIDNARVCLMSSQNNIYDVGYTNEVGVTSITVHPTIVADTILVTVTAPDELPYIGSILVVPASGPYVIPKRLEIFDHRGNNDGKVNPAETIDLGVWAMNVGSDPAFFVSGALSESDDYVDIQNNWSQYGHVMAGDSSHSYPNYVFDVAGNCPDQHLIKFTFTFTDRYQHIWTSNKSVLVYAPILVYDDVTVLNDDSDNGALEPGETGDLIVTLKNIGHGTAPGTKCVLFSESPYITINTPTALYGDIEPGATAANNDYPYSVTVSNEAPYLSEAEFSLYIRAGYYANIVDFTIDLGKHVPSDEDSQYYAYWSGGPHEHSPAFEWIAIDSTQTEYPGVSLDLSDENPVAMLDLPFTMPYYDDESNYLGVGQHGYVRIGGPRIISFPENDHIPRSRGPRALVAGVWDYLDAGFPDSPSDIYYYYDEPNHRFIVEFFMVEHEEGGDFETFEIILYDPAYYPTPDGKGEIVVQYLTAPQQEDITVGIESPDKRLGIQYYYDGEYHEHAEPITDSFAIKYTTYSPYPEAAANEHAHGPQSFDDPPTVPSRTLMSIPYPNPFRNTIAISYQLAAGSTCELKIYDATGRLVKQWNHETMQQSNQIIWDGCDDTGHKVSAGIYFVRFVADDYTKVSKTILLQ